MATRIEGFCSPSPSGTDRASGLAQLLRFLPRAGERYARERNRDRGPGAHSEVSQLSHWIRHRQLLELEVIEAALREHGWAARKFIEEIGWRSYWKGWMEQHPAAWTRYRERLAALHEQLSATPCLQSALQRACEGATGIDCFDAWAHELRDSGYLHNHARMWFASIWIFTLKLPWELGADFFLRHLIDGDAGVNTLSWRWVAGLQTVGKHYVARADNIREFTGGRHDPRGQLDEDPAPLSEDSPPPLVPLSMETDFAPRGPLLMLLTDEDLHAESLPLGSARPAEIVGVNLAATRAHGGVNPKVIAHVDAALDDALFRAAQHYTAPAQRLSGTDTLLAWASRHAPGLPIVTARLPVGPARDALMPVFEQLQRAGHPVTQLTRPWDAAAWPRAREGFFKFRRYMPALIEEFAPQGADASAPQGAPCTDAVPPLHAGIAKPHAASPQRKIAPCPTTI